MCGSRRVLGGEGTGLAGPGTGSGLLCVLGDTGACEQRRSLFHLGLSRVPLAAPGEGWEQGDLPGGYCSSSSRR